MACNTSKFNLPTKPSYLHHVSRSYYSTLLRKNQTIDDLPPFASTKITCPSLLNVLVMPAIVERYDIMINTLYHNVACCTTFFHNINTYSLIVGSLQQPPTMRKLQSSRTLLHLRCNPSKERSEGQQGKSHLRAQGDTEAVRLGS